MAFQYPGFQLNAFQITRRGAAAGALPSLGGSASGVVGEEQQKVTSGNFAGGSPARYVVGLGEGSLPSLAGRAMGRGQPFSDEELIEIALLLVADAA